MASRLGLSSQQASCNNRSSFLDIDFRLVFLVCFSRLFFFSWLHRNGGNPQASHITSWCLDILPTAFLLALRSRERKRRDCEEERERQTWREEKTIERYKYPQFGSHLFWSWALVGSWLNGKRWTALVKGSVMSELGQSMLNRNSFRTRSTSAMELCEFILIKWSQQLSYLSEKGYLDI